MIDIKKTGQTVLTAVLATIASSITFFGVLGFVNRNFPSASPKIQIDLATPLLNAGKTLTDEDEKVIAKKIVKWRLAYKQAKEEIKKES